MKFEDFLLMRHELLLTITAMLILMAEIFIDSKNKNAK